MLVNSAYKKCIKSRAAVTQDYLKFEGNALIILWLVGFI
jgi:hypothetical protein